MSVNIRTIALLTIVLALGACTTGASGPPSLTPANPTPRATVPSPTIPSASPKAIVTPPPTVAPTAAAVPTTFTSTTYGYSLTLPAGWIAIPASTAWDGTSAISHDSAEVDQFVISDAKAASGIATPTPGDVKALAKKTISDTAKYHSNTCKAAPTLQTPIKVGSQPGILLAFDCGILINNAVVVQDGIGYTFLFRDRSVHAPTDPTDQATFEAFLGSVKFP
jgi:hypothetical protein